MSTVQAPNERVLSTMNVDGTRRWMRPTLSPGSWWNRRVVIAWALIVLFVALPLIQVGGKPSILLDLPRREFTFFGTTLLATDTVILMLFLLGVFMAIFLATALFGRVWCGWGCPQTVYMEFVFRPIERLIEGDRKAQERLDAQRLPPRRVLKWAIFAVLSVVLANVFLAYFVGVDQLALWVLHSPAEHPQGFAVVAATSLMMFIDFAWFRDQMCVVACPYARLQSVLLDKRSLIVAYDVNRGEPRGKLKKVATADLSLGAVQSGDCIDCKACVYTCPTGIDIRDGLQLECISCTQCIDACDTIMDKIGKPRGLVRYSSQQEILDKAPLTAKHRLARVRTVLYPLGLLVIFGLFLLALSRRTNADITVLRGIGAPFVVLQDGTIQNTLRVRIHNHSGKDKRYQVELTRAAGFQLVAPSNPIPVKGGELRTEGLFLLGKAAAIGKKREIGVTVDDGEGLKTQLSFQLLGPGSP